MSQAEFVQHGDTVDYTPVADAAAGDVVVQGDLVGVTKRDIKANTLGALAVEGVFDFAKEAGGGVTFAAGDLAYWDDTNDVAVTTDGAGANKLLGKAVAAAADTDSSVRVKLTP
jgi:predicted RecA/RadA family phage recombinase